jgi:hypothetical protein
LSGVKDEGPFLRPAYATVRAKLLLKRHHLSVAIPSAEQDQVAAVRVGGQLRHLDRDGVWIV